MITILNYSDNTRNFGLNSCSINLLNIFKYKHSTDIVYSYEIHSERFLDTNVENGKKIRLSSLAKSLNLTKQLPYNLRIPKKADDYNDFVEIWNNGKGGIRSKKIIKKLKNTEVLLFNAEGSCYRNNFGSLSGLFLLYYFKSLFPERKAFFVNGSITISSIDDYYTGIFKRLNECGVKFFVREPLSGRQLHSINIDNQTIPDTAFINTSKKNYEAKENNIIAVSNSMLSVNKELYVQLLEDICLKYKAKVISIAIDPHDVYLNEINSPFFSALDINNFNEAEKIIARSCLMISGRYHHLIFAIKQSIPIIPLNTTSHKIKGLLELINYSGKVYDPTNLKMEKPGLVEEVGSLLNKGIIPNYSKTIKPNNIIKKYEDIVK